MSKIDFQDSGCGGHLGFSIGSNLATLCLIGALMFVIVSTQLDHSLQRRCQKFEFSTFFPYKCTGPIQIHGEANLTLP